MRVRRRLLAIAPLLSLALCIASLAAWLRSELAVDQFYASWAGAAATPPRMQEIDYLIRSANGGFVLQRTAHISGARRNPLWSFELKSTDGPERARDYPNYDHRTFLGCQLKRDRAGLVGIVVAYPVLAILFAILPVWRSRRRLKWARADDHGFSVVSAHVSQN